MKRRLRLDTTQSEEQRHQRRHAFPQTATTHKQLQKMRHLSLNLQLQQQSSEASGGYRDGCSPRGGNRPRGGNSPRGGSSPRGGDCLQGCSSPRGNFVPNHVVDPQHRTSAEMAASIMPEPSGDGRAFHSSGSATPPMSPKYFVGNEIVDWRNQGRRMTRSPTRDSLQVGGVFCSPQARSVANLHDPQSARGGAAVSSGLSRAASMQSVAMPAAAKASFEGQVHCFGETSLPPSSLLKDKAFVHSGLTMVKFGSRSPGHFSPNAPRVALAPVMSS